MKRSASWWRAAGGLQTLLAVALCIPLSGCATIKDLGLPDIHLPALSLAEPPMPVIGRAVKIPLAEEPALLFDTLETDELTQVPGYLDLPDGKPRGAVVLLHGCQGLDLGTRLSMIAWSEWWNSQGFATLAVDSLGPRGVEQACIGEVNRERGDLIVRRADALAAAQYLARAFGLPAARIGLQGFSHGGQAAISLARDGARDLGWVIALYPGCDGRPERVRLPTLVLLGEKDEWTGGSFCDETPEASEGIKVVVLPHATHLFDQPLPAHIAYGYEVDYAPDAVATARKKIRKFVARSEK
jgi:dienelactone hydrolase